MDTYILNFSSKDLETIVQLVSTLAGCFTVFIAYSSIRQVKKLNQNKNESDQKYKTIDIVTEPSSGLSYLSREPKKNRSIHYEYLNWSISEIDTELQLSEYGCSDKTIEFLSSRLKTRAPLNRNIDHGVEYIRDFNKTLAFKPFSLESEVHKSYANLFNRLEDIASAINSGLLDIKLLNFMYGGMINSIYRDHSEWVSWVKRNLGLRIYDQSDILIDKLLKLSSSRYSLHNWSFLLRIYFQGEEGRSLFWDIVSKSSVYSKSQYLTSNGFTNELLKRGILKNIDYYAKFAFQGEVKIKVKPALTIKNSRGIKKKIHSLFSDCWRESKGIWPVNVQPWEEKTELKQDNFNTWFSAVTLNWKVVFLASFHAWNKREIAGMIALTYGDTLVKNRERWSLEITGAIESSMGGASEVVKKNYMEKIGIPLIMEKGKYSIDFDKMALIQSFYTHSDLRKNYGFENTGRKLFRESVFYARNQLGLIPFLTVIADNEFTQRAVELYIGEGGAYLGTVRDAGRADQHLMHVFVF